MAHLHQISKNGIMGKSRSGQWRSHELQTAHDNVTAVPCLSHHEAPKHAEMDQKVGPPQMHAGVPEMGAVDAWHAVLTS